MSRSRRSRSPVARCLEVRRLQESVRRSELERSETQRELLRQQAASLEEARRRVAVGHLVATAPTLSGADIELAALAGRGIELRERQLEQALATQDSVIAVRQEALRKVAVERRALETLDGRWQERRRREEARCERRSVEATWLLHHRGDAGAAREPADEP